MGIWRLEGASAGRYDAQPSEKAVICSLFPYAALLRTECANVGRMMVGTESECEDGVPELQIQLAAALPAEHVVPTQELKKIAEALDPRPTAQLRVMKMLRELNLQYSARKLVGTQYAPYTESLDLVSNVEKQSAAVAQALVSMMPDLLALIEANRSGQHPPSNKRLRLPAYDLAAELLALAASAAEVRALLPNRARKRPEQSDLKRVVGILVRSLTRSGHAVIASTSKDSIPCSHLSGSGGELIAKFFALMDPDVSEGTLTRIVAELRRKTALTTKSPVPPT